MRAAVIHSTGTTPVFAEFADPEVAAGKEMIELVAAGIHPVVRALAAGTHYGSSAGAGPSIPGVDVVGRTADGALVYTGYVEDPWGTMAERMAVAVGRHSAVPESADPLAVAAGLNPGLSSWLPLTAHRAAGGALNTVLIVGATGVAGGLAVQNALQLGASRVVAVGRDRERLDVVAALGAIAVPLDGGAAAIRAALDGAAPDLVLDFVWGEPAELVFSALATRGLGDDAARIAYLSIGESAGEQARVPGSLLRSRRMQISGSGAGSTPIAEMMVQLPRYLQLLADGTVTVPYRAYPLADVAAAWADRTPGRRVVITG